MLKRFQFFDKDVATTPDGVAFDALEVCSVHSALVGLVLLFCCLAVLVLFLGCLPGPKSCCVFTTNTTNATVEQTMNVVDATSGRGILFFASTEGYITVVGKDLDHFKWWPHDAQIICMTQLRTQSILITAGVRPCVLCLASLALHPLLWFHTAPVVSVLDTILSSQFNSVLLPFLFSSS